MPCRSYISLRFHSTASPLLPPPINFSASSANRFRELFFLFLFSSFPPSFLPSKCTYVYASLEFFILIISLHLFILLFPLFFFHLPFAQTTPTPQSQAFMTTTTTPNPQKADLPISKHSAIPNPNMKGTNKQTTKNGNTKTEQWRN